MLTTQQAFVNPYVERLLKEVQLENSRFDRELRAVKRERIVLPVVLKFLDDSEEICAFTRDLSVSGACLITNRQIEEKTVSVIRIYRLKKEESEVISEARWCRPFGPNFWISGWQFIRLPRD